MQPVTRLPFEVTAVHAVIGFEMPDDGLDGLSPLEQLSLLRAQALGLTPVHDAHIRVLCIHPPVAQIHKRRRGLDRTVLHQDRGLLELFAQRRQTSPMA